MRERNRPDHPTHPDQQTDATPGRRPGHRLRAVVDEHAMSLAEALDELGVDLRPPEALSERQLDEQLWEVIRALAGLEIFLNCTDHLSDRELYRWIFEELLPEPLGPPAERSGLAGFWIADPLAGGGAEEVAVYLRYYADEVERRRWAARGWSLPARRRRPHARDDRLPRPGRGQ